MKKLYLPFFRMDYERYKKLADHYLDLDCYSQMADEEIDEEAERRIQEGGCTFGLPESVFTEESEIEIVYRQYHASKYLEGDILDIGCLTGIFPLWLAARGKDVTSVTGLELSKKALKVARYYAKRLGLDVRFVHGFVQKMPFKEGEFSSINCQECLEHLPYIKPALLEIRRVLKPGGLFCGTVPYRWYAEPHPMHFHVFFFSTEIKWLLKRYFVDVKVELIPNKRAEDRSTQIFWVARKLES